MINIGTHARLDPNNEIRSMENKHAHTYAHTHTHTHTRDNKECLGSAFKHS